MGTAAKCPPDDRHERMMYILAEETAAETAAVLPYRAGRRAACR